MLRPELAAEIGAERFLREIKIAAGLNHPHILPLFDSGEADGLLFYVMPYVEGDRCGSGSTGERQLPLDEALPDHPGGRRRRSTTPTATGWSTATSSRRTSCCTKAPRWWPTSASARR